MDKNHDVLPVVQNLMIDYMKKNIHLLNEIISTNSKNPLQEYN